MLTSEQQTTLAQHIRANPDPDVVSALAVRNDDLICDWYNTASSTDAWDSAVSRLKLMEETNFNVHKTLTQGERDSWGVILDQAGIQPLDYGRQKVRGNTRDCWAAAQSDALLAACTRKATRGELVFGGPTESTGSIFATDLAVEVVLTPTDISTALNNNP